MNNNTAPKILAYTAWSSGILSFVLFAAGFLIKENWAIVYFGVASFVCLIILGLSCAIIGGREFDFAQFNKAVQSNLCPHCKYDMTGLQDRCPECGGNIHEKKPYTKNIFLAIVISIPYAIGVFFAKKYFLFLLIGYIVAYFWVPKDLKKGLLLLIVFLLYFNFKNVWG